MTKKEDYMLEALAQNYSFKIKKQSKLPPINYVYPDYTSDGNAEDFRFDSGLRKKLSTRENIIRQNLNGKKIAYTSDKSILLEVGEIAPRLGLKEQISGEVRGSYIYAPLLFVGKNGIGFTAYVVKPIIDASMAWFELTQDETKNIRKNLKEKIEAKPYKTLLQRIFK